MNDITESDIVVRNSKNEKWLRLSFFVFSEIFGYWLYFYENDYRGTAVMFIGFSFLIGIRKKFVRKPKVLLRINSQRVWVRGKGELKWNEIKAIKLIRKKDALFLEFYLTSEITSDYEISLQYSDYSYKKLKKIFNLFVPVKTRNKIIQKMSL